MNMRIGGLASGMDIDQLVSDLMRVERTKVDKVYQERTLASWRQEAYQEVNRLFANFILETKKDFGLSQTTASGVLLSSSVSSLDWVKKASLSNPDLGTVKATANAVAGSYELQVHRLASNWSSASGEAISVGNKDNLATQFGLTEADILDITITTNLGELTISKEENSSNVTMKLGEHTIYEEDLSNVTINDLVREINQADIGVVAMYDANADRFFLQTENTGSNNTIQITDRSVLPDGDNSTNFINGKLKLKYLDAAGDSQDVEGVEYGGVDALIDFGAAQGIAQHSNNFTLNNINFSLKATGSSKLDVATDVEGMLTKIKNFVDKYNEFVDKINGELGEKRYSDYLPLTDEQKEAMTEDQIKKWEEKGKSGLLRNDMILSRTMSSARSGLYEEVAGISGIFAQLTEIGITTESYVQGSRGGKLVINEQKLVEAIEKDADSVLELLFKKPDSSLTTKQESKMTAEEIQEKRSQSGLITRLYDNLIAGMKDVIVKAGPGNDSGLYRNVSSTMLLDFVVDYGSISMLEDNMDDLTKKINTLETYLAKREERYWRQFTEMEKAINLMNQQSLWLAQQFGGGM
jgi:flagellar hook-associated protein 2